MMTFRPERIFALRISALIVGAALVAPGAFAQNRPAPSSPESPYGGVTVEDILARVNDQIITKSDYERALKEMDQEAHDRGLSMQQTSDAHKDLLRNLIDQQLWLSKGKELGITGETELIKQLDDIRKKYNLETLDDLEKAAKEQGVSFEDFKANIRNQIVTQQVMRDQVGRKVSVTPGEAQRYYEAHKQEYAQPESVKLSEIMISTGSAVPSATTPGAMEDVDANKLAAAKAKAEDVEAKLKAGADFDQLARTQSDGQTAAEGGDLGKYVRGSLAKVLEDATFSLKSGQFTEPILTRQGYVILKVVEHVPGGVPPFKDVQEQVEEQYYMTRMEPAIREYLTTLREQAFIDIRPGYADTGASAKETKPIYSAYTPPAPKKKKKVERTRFRETEHGFRKKAAVPVEVSATTTPAANGKKAKKGSAADAGTMKAGKKEKIRFGQAPRETLPNAAATRVEDAGAVEKTTADAAAEQTAAEAPAPVVKKTRYEARSKLPKVAKSKGPQLDPFSPAAPDAAEVADRQTQSAPLGLGGDTTGKAKKKKTNSATKQEKKRLENEKRKKQQKPQLELTPAAPAQGAPAPKKVTDAAPVAEPAPAAPAADATPKQ